MGSCTVKTGLIQDRISFKDLRKFRSSIWNLELRQTFLPAQYLTMYANTPKPPYYAVIFSSVRNEHDQEAYDRMSRLMADLAKQQPGYLGVESTRTDLGITVSYWKSLEDIKNWKKNEEHLIAQRLGKKEWYKSFKVRIAAVEREYGFGNI